MQRARPYTALCVALATALALVAPSATAAASPDAHAAPALTESMTATAASWKPKVSRIAGPDRYATAVLVSRQTRSSGPPGTVFIASGEAYPDALSAASGVEGTQDRMLLVKRSSIPREVRDELLRLKPSQIVIVGGTGVIDPAVERALRALPIPQLLSVERVGGADRYQTSVRLADAVRAWRGPAVRTGPHVSTVVTGRNFPDALAAVGARMTFGPAAHPGPVLLVDGASTSVDPAVLRVLRDYRTMQTRIVGGTGVISAGIERRVPGPERIAGVDRYATAAVLVNRSPTMSSIAYLTTGTSFPDALAASAAASAQQAALYLTPSSCVPAYVLKDMRANGIRDVRILGGPSVLGAGVAALKPCADPPWLAEVNAARKAFGVHPLHEDPILSGGLAAHIDYNAKNRRTTDWEWTESAGNPHRTALGTSYAQEAFLNVGGSLDISRALRSPFQLAHVLDPSTSATGAGAAKGKTLWAMSSSWSLFDSASAPAPRSTFASWPANGAVVSKSSFSAIKARPNPWALCPSEYRSRYADGSQELGAPILIRLDWSGGRPLQAELRRDGTPVPICLVAPGDDVKPQSGELGAGIEKLGSSSTALVLPLEPFRRASSYTLVVDHRGSTYQSSFRTEG